jgi:hypothetical protein
MEVPEATSTGTDRAVRRMSPIVESRLVIDAVFWDFGGVILTSPFEAFNRYELERGLPADVIRTINARDAHANAWARLERTEITPEQFDAEFAREATTFPPPAGATSGPRWSRRSTQSSRRAIAPRASRTTSWVASTAPTWRP